MAKKVDFSKCLKSGSQIDIGASTGGELIEFGVGNTGNFQLTDSSGNLVCAELYELPALSDYGDGNPTPTSESKISVDTDKIVYCLGFNEVSIIEEYEYLQDRDYSKIEILNVFVPQLAISNNEVTISNISTLYNAGITDDDICVFRLYKGSHKNGTRYHGFEKSQSRGIPDSVMSDVVSHVYKQRIPWTTSNSMKAFRIQDGRSYLTNDGVSKCGPYNVSNGIIEGFYSDIKNYPPKGHNQSLCGNAYGVKGDPEYKFLGIIIGIKKYGLTAREKRAVNLEIKTYEPHWCYKYDDSAAGRCCSKASSNCIMYKETTKVISLSSSYYTAGYPTAIL